MTTLIAVVALVMVISMVLAFRALVFSRVEHPVIQQKRKAWKR